MATSHLSDADGEFERLRDEVEQLRTALESAQDDASKLAGDRDQLLGMLAALSRDFHHADSAFRRASRRTVAHLVELPKHELTGVAEHELRAAIEEMQVLAEELEVANEQLLEQNAALDRRVAERTEELGAAQAAVAELEASFRAVADLVPDYLWQSDAEGRVRWFSRRWYDLTGQRDDEALNSGWLEAIHFADRYALRTAHEAARARGEPYQVEARVESWRGGERWFLMRAEPFRDESGEIRQWFGAGTDIHEQRLTFEALEQSEHRFRTLVEGIPQLVWRSGRGGHWTWSSPQWSATTGLSAAESRGLGWLRAWHPDDRAAALEAWQRAGDTCDFAAEGRIFHAGEQRYRHFRTRGAAVASADGATHEWLGTSTDVDDITRLQQQQTVLVGELQHRTRNILTVVQSVVRRTIRGSADLGDFTARIEARLGALARVQGLLSRRTDNHRITFDQLLRAELGAHVALDEGVDGQVTLDGPADVPLYSGTIQIMALALHELATNAIKYGALSTPAGRLDISWRMRDGGDPRLSVDWRESGVADLPRPGDAPRGSGYGRELIERALPYQLQAKTSYRFADDGVHCTIEVPVATEMTGGRQ